MLTEDMLQPLLQQMFKMSHFMNTSPEMSSPFVNRLTDSCLLYARTQTLLQLVFQKLFKVVFVYPFVAHSSTDLLAPNLQTHTDVLKQNVILFAQTHFRN